MTTPDTTPAAANLSASAPVMAMTHEALAQLPDVKQVLTPTDGQTYDIDYLSERPVIATEQLPPDGTLGTIASVKTAGGQEYVVKVEVEDGEIVEGAVRITKPDYDPSATEGDAAWCIDLTPKMPEIRLPAGGKDDESGEFKDVEFILDTYGIQIGTRRGQEAATIVLGEFTPQAEIDTVPRSQILAMLAGKKAVDGAVEAEPQAAEVSADTLPPSTLAGLRNAAEPTSDQTLSGLAARVAGQDLKTEKVQTLADYGQTEQVPALNKEAIELAKKIPDDLIELGQDPHAIMRPEILDLLADRLAVTQRVDELFREGMTSAGELLSESYAVAHRSIFAVEQGAWATMAATQTMAAHLIEGIDRQLSESRNMPAAFAEHSQHLNSLSNALPAAKVAVQELRQALQNGDQLTDTHQSQARQLVQFASDYHGVYKGINTSSDAIHITAVRMHGQSGELAGDARSEIRRVDQAVTDGYSGAVDELELPGTLVQVKQRGANTVHQHIELCGEDMDASYKRASAFSNSVAGLEDVTFQLMSRTRGLNEVEFLHPEHLIPVVESVLRIVNQSAYGEPFDVRSGFELTGTAVNYLNQLETAVTNLSAQHGLIQDDVQLLLQRIQDLRQDDFLTQRSDSAYDGPQLGY